MSPTAQTSQAEPPASASAVVRSAPGRLAAPITARELVLVVLGGMALAAATSWPLALHLSSRISPDIGDPIRTAWQVAFGGHQILTHPGALWSSNAFWPHPDSFLFSDTLLGYAPTAFVGSGPVAAIVRYNLLWLFAYSLSFVGAYLLARELRAGRVGAVVAGAAFAYAPYRLDEAGHLHVVSAGGIALCLFALLRGYRRRAPGLILAGWLIGAWQMSLGFTLGLQLAYLLLGVVVVGGALCLRQRAAARRLLARERSSGALRAVVVASVAGMAVMGAVTAVEANGYLRVGREYPTAKRSISEVQRYSAPVEAFLAAPAANRIWGGATAGVRHHLRSQNESALFPGLTVVVLALFGLAGTLYSRRLKAALALVVIVTAIISLGFNPTFGHLTYRPLFRLAPGFDAIRTPGRFAMMTSLALALLAAAGTRLLIGRALAHPRRPARLSAPLLATGLSALLAALVVVEGTGHLGHPRVPVLPASVRNLSSLRGPLLMLPTDSAADRAYQLFSTQGWPTIANGNSTFEIPAADDLRGGMQNFPDAPGVRKLEALGIRTVVLFTDLRENPAYPFPGVRFATPEPPDAAAAARKPVTGLGIGRRVLPGGVVVYSIP